MDEELKRYENAWSCVPHMLQWLGLGIPGLCAEHEAGHYDQIGTYLTTRTFFEFHGSKKHSSGPNLGQLKWKQECKQCIHIKKQTEEIQAVMRRFILLDLKFLIGLGRSRKWV